MSVAIIINSCFKFYETTVPIIIDSAKKANIPMKNMYVVVGESDYESPITETDDGYNIIFCKYVNIDYNGAIYFTQTVDGVNELKKYTHFFYLHDTCSFTNLFWEKICNYAQICPMYIKTEHRSTKNIGLINVEWFLLNKRELFSYYINYDKTLVLEYKDGNFPNKNVIYDKFNNLPEWLNEDCLFIFENNRPFGPIFNNPHIPTYYCSIYSDEPRRATVYEEPGIIKYQKNFGIGPWDITL